jgi:hypothetical protein
VPAPRHRHLRLLALASAAVLVLAGCSGASGGSDDATVAEGSASSSAASPSAGSASEPGSGSPSAPRESASAAPSPTASPTASATASATRTPSAAPTTATTVQVPAGIELTDPGSRLKFGDVATVIYEPTTRKGSTLRLTVRGVQKGSLADFGGFILDDPYKQNANYYYARVRVTNVGEGDVGGVPVPLWGVDGQNTLLRPVTFTTPFAKCPSRPLPARFGPGAVLNTCLVYLSPDHGSLEAVSFRPNEEFDPISWSGTIRTPAPAGG